MLGHFANINFRCGDRVIVKKDGSEGTITRLSPQSVFVVTAHGKLWFQRHELQLAEQELPKAQRR
jgi:hypothetical protein